MAKKEKRQKNKDVDMGSLIDNMKTIQWLEIRSPWQSPFDIKGLQKKNVDLKIHQFRKINLHQEIADYVMKYGLSDTVNPEYFHFTGKTTTRREEFIIAIQRFLDVILKGKTLVIVDPYIFPKKYDSDYVIFFDEILQKYYSKLSTINFVTSPDANPAVQKKIIDLIKVGNPQIKVKVQYSTEFHDRFWISPRNRKGIFMGTSLNGLGRKYTVIDYLNDDDVREILSGVKKII